MEQGLVHIYCGEGKGKTTAATGLAVRCAGAGGKVLWFQFLKKDTSGERQGLSLMDEIHLVPGYDKVKFTFQMTEKEKQEARKFYQDALSSIRERVKQGEYDLLVLDEAIGAVNGNMITEDELVSFLREKPKGLEVVLTGRKPSERLLENADYVTCMQKVKHPFDKGVNARRKIEW